MTGQASPRRGGLIVGLVLILLGGAALLVQVGGLTIGWPIWIIVPGLALILGAVAVGGSGGAGIASVGGIVLMTGIVLAVQEANGLYQTWAYAWALVAPGGVGVGLTVYGLLARRSDDLRAGLTTLFVSVVLFLVGFLFFEGVVGLSGNRFAEVTEVAVPLLLVCLGVLVIIGAFVPGPWRRPVMVVHDAKDRAAAERGEGGSGWTAPVPERLAIPLEDAADAEVMVTFGAGHLRLGAAGPGLLVDGQYAGGVKVERGGGPGRVRLSPPSPPAGWTWDRAPYTWTMGVTAEVPLRLRVESGAADAQLDLSSPAPSRAAPAHGGERHERHAAGRGRPDPRRRRGRCRVNPLPRPGRGGGPRSLVDRAWLQRCRPGPLPAERRGRRLGVARLRDGAQPRRDRGARRHRQRLGALSRAHAAAASAPQPATRIPNRTRQSTATEPTVELAGRACG